MYVPIIWYDLFLTGFTNGPCTQFLKGKDFRVEGYSNTSAVSMIYYEGTPGNMFRDTQLRIYMEGGEWTDYVQV